MSVSVFELIAPELGNVSQSDFISGSCCLVVSFYSLVGGIVPTSIKQERAMSFANESMNTLSFDNDQ